MESMEVVEALGALAQESRLAVFRLLVRQGPQGMPAGDIADKIAVPATTLSFHLSQLSHAGLVSARREGRSIYYAADYKRMQELLDFLMANCCEASGSCAPPTKINLQRPPAGPARKKG
jgi:ArsR family transcriptional regulator, arsenate/arsenite/antimonite-responsive transcriptional repressor